MAKTARERRGASIRIVCKALGISETCYRYQPKLSDENAVIADWLIRLTHNWKDWGFGLCFLFLRNVKGYGWNHKRVYRIYKELELNLRIKPKNRIEREKPEPLRVPEAINECWSMDFMHDALEDGRAFRLFNLSMILIVKAWASRLIFRYPVSASFVHWNRLLNGEASPWRFVVIMVRSTLVRQLRNGLRSRISGWNSFNQASLNKMPTLNDIIGQSDMPGSANTCLKRLMKYGIFLLGGYGLTITKDQIWRWEELRQCRN